MHANPARNQRVQPVNWLASQLTNQPTRPSNVPVIWLQEQVEWIVKAEADLIIAETFGDVGEAKLALEAIQKYGNGQMDGWMDR